MTALPVPEPLVPMFEGKEVSATKIKLSSTGALPVGDRTFRMDDIVHFVVEARVNQVHHNVNETNGTLERVHSAKVLSVEVTPWNAQDPQDDGVFRG